MWETSDVTFLVYCSPHNFFNAMIFAGWFSPVKMHLRQLKQSKHQLMSVILFLLSLSCRILDAWLSCSNRPWCSWLSCHAERLRTNHCCRHIHLSDLSWIFFATLWYTLTWTYIMQLKYAQSVGVWFGEQRQKLGMVTIRSPKARPRPKADRPRPKAGRPKAENSD